MDNLPNTFCQLHLSSNHHMQVGHLSRGHRAARVQVLALGTQPSHRHRVVTLPLPANSRLFHNLRHQASTLHLLANSSLHNLLSNSLHSLRSKRGRVLSLLLPASSFLCSLPLPVSCPHCLQFRAVILPLQANCLRSSRCHTAGPPKASLTCHRRLRLQHLAPMARCRPLMLAASRRAKHPALPSRSSPPPTTVHRKACQHHRRHCLQLTLGATRTKQCSRRPLCPAIHFRSGCVF
mmetsp:Transcript_32457/g.74168  ORF Transcript_32457/g.74168 Transcript_32457/m.74168 type:complete len:236 (+) Transcript_32457:1048-1755(+)